MYAPKTSPRREYLERENLRVQASPSLIERFPHLNSVTADLGYYDPGGFVRSSQIKYIVNVKNAKSIFRVACHNHECVCGDFDLSEALLQAVQAKQTSVSGEIHCRGWRNHSGIGSVPCGNLLRYTFTLAY